MTGHRHIADGSIWLFGYTLSAGKVTQTLVTDPRSIQRRTSFNTSGFVTEDIAAFGQCEQRTTTYSRPDSTNRVATRTTASPVTTCTDQPGRQSSYTYDEVSGKVRSITRLAGTANAVTSYFTYEPRYHQLASATDPLGQATTLHYDPQGNLVVATDPTGRSTVLTYNRAGQPLTVTDPLDHVAQLTYALGDLVSVTDPNGQTTRRFVDNAGRLASATNPLGQQTRREYDRLGRVLKTTDAQGQVTEFGYDPNSWLTSVKDTLNHTTSYTRDETNRVRQRTDPLTQSDAYTYDLNGNLKQVTDRRGKVTTYCYDNLDRRTFAGFGTITPPGLCAAGPNYESTIVYTYDKGDRLRDANDSAKASSRAPTTTGTG